ncbi:citrate transporter [Clostridium sp. AF18-27]|uniref:citrate transporter n=1 Tax=Enterocloster lavalensis TaxID=460384 RepID=UPI000E473898|nr:citrate transporter [Enterocloster lavalensis]MCB6341975.1 citrate transporter [Enterocloster lavalensis]RHR57259.1 citrate transporter [Clostridium sp. AF18-27]
MFDTPVMLTPLHYAYLIGVIAILAVMVRRRDTPAVCIAFLFILGVIGLGSVAGGIMTVFNAVLYAAREFMEVIATIALVTALSKCLKDLGSDYLMMVPMSRVMKTPSLTWWILGLTMFLFSLFLWPSPSVALVGAIMLPFAVKAGLNPLAAAMAMNLFGHGFALSYDFVIQGAPGVSAGAAGVSSADILTQAAPVFWVMGIATVVSAFLLNRRTMGIQSVVPAGPRLFGGGEGADSGELPSGGDGGVSGTDGLSRKPAASRKAAMTLAILTPLAFLADILMMFAFNLKGGDATSLVSGTAALVMCAGAALGFKGRFLEKVTDYVTDGFLFAIRIFAPVIIIGAFFFLGGSGITTIMGDQFQSGIMNDWAVWLAHNAPLNKYMAALIQMVVGALTGLDGSGFSGLPLTGSLARTFGLAVGASVPVLASLGQITAIFVGGGTIVPWGLIPVAAICDVSPLELARKNLLPVLIGFICAFFTACLLL